LVYNVLKVDRGCISLVPRKPESYSVEASLPGKGEDMSKLNVPAQLDTVVLNHLAAFNEFIKYAKLTYSVSDKFIDDHTMTVMTSSKNASERAVQRYVANQRILTSTWMMLDKATILNKAKGCNLANARSLTYREAQQIAIPIKAIVRTITVEKLAKNDIPRYKNSSVEVTIGSEVHTLRCTSKDGVEDAEIHIVGPWNPLTGEVVLYHFEMGLPPQNNHTMLEKYMKWYRNEDKTLLRPVAKK